MFIRNGMLLVVVALVIGFVSPAAAQQPAGGHDASELAKASQNPIRRLAAVSR